MLGSKIDDFVRDFCPVGKHLARIDGDILWLCVRGVAERAEMVEISALSLELYQRHGFALVLCDATEAAGLTAEARRHQNERHKEQVFPSHTAIYGASMLVRGLIVLGQRATELVTGKKIPVSFHKTEAEARAQLDHQRTRLIINRQAAPATD